MRLQINRANNRHTKRILNRSTLEQITRRYETLYLLIHFFLFYLQKKII